MQREHQEVQRRARELEVPSESVQRDDVAFDYRDQDRPAAGQERQPLRAEQRRDQVPEAEGICPLVQAAALPGTQASADGRGQGYQGTRLLHLQGALDSIYRHQRSNRLTLEGQ